MRHFPGGPDVRSARRGSCRKRNQEPPGGVALEREGEVPALAEIERAEAVLLSLKAGVVFAWWREAFIKVGGEVVEVVA